MTYNVFGGTLNPTLLLMEYAFTFRKAVKAALVLLPLLGANNILAITGPFDISPIHYGLWSFASFAMTGFQGVLFSLLYCFSNSDVRINKLHVTRKTTRPIHK